MFGQAMGMSCRDGESGRQQQWRVHTTHTHTPSKKQNKKSSPCRGTRRRTRRPALAGIDHRGLLVFMSPLSRLSPLLSCVLTHSGSIIVPPRLRSDVKVPWSVRRRARAAAAARSGTRESCRGVHVTHSRRGRVASPRLLQMAL